MIILLLYVSVLSQSVQAITHCGAVIDWTRLESHGVWMCSVPIHGTAEEIGCAIQALRLGDGRDPIAVKGSS